MQPDRRINHVKKILKTGRGLRMTAQIQHYDMDYIILDSGFDVSIIMRQTWESMEIAQMDWYPIKLILEN